MEERLRISNLLRALTPGSGLGAGGVLTYAAAPHLHHPGATEFCRAPGFYFIFCGVGLLESGSSLYLIKIFRGRRNLRGFTNHCVNEAGLGRP